MRGSHGLSARRARRTKSSRPEGPQLEVGAQRAPRLLYFIFYIYIWKPTMLLHPEAIFLVWLQNKPSVLRSKIFLYFLFLKNIFIFFIFDKHFYIFKLNLQYSGVRQSWSNLPPRVVGLGLNISKWEWTNFKMETLHFRWECSKDRRWDWNLIGMSRFCCLYFLVIPAFVLFKKKLPHPI